LRRTDRGVAVEASWQLSRKRSGEHRRGDHRDLRARDAADPDELDLARAEISAKIGKLVRGTVIGLAAACSSSSPCSSC